MRNSIRSIPYKIYKYNIFPKIKGKKGSHWVKDKLAQLAVQGLEKSDDSNTQPIMSEEWDNLIILDACRYDVYQDVIGECGKRVSLGSHSREFVRKNFSEGENNDTVYIAGNAHVSPELFENNTGRDVSKVFHTIYKTYDTDWNEDYGVVGPEGVARDAKSAEKLYPDKRKIIHFMQPHAPYIPYNLERGEALSTSNDDFILYRAERGEVDREFIWEEYRKNLEFVWQYVEELVDELEGRTVVTADHGELLGENGLYGHPYGLKTRVLREVPWDVVQER